VALEYADNDALGWGKGTDATNWQPGEWTNAPSGSPDEYQPDLDPPRIPDYANLRKHKHYRQYFRPYRFAPFPAWIYNHKTRESKIVKSKEEVIEHGPDWGPVPFDVSPNLVGKSLPVKSHAEQMNDNIKLLVSQNTGGKVDANLIGGIVAAVMQAMNGGQSTSALVAKPAEPKADSAEERGALEELAVEKGIEVDGRWSNETLKRKLGLL
jgi:hypothetical protein